MNVLKKTAAAVLCLVLLLTTTACSTGFADYDVSAYVDALLDSNYHADHTALKEIAGVSDAQAQADHDTTVENAAIYFCNTYSISPSEQQLAELKAIMRQAFALTKYTVKEERKVDGGYYLEVEVAAITNFEDCAEKIEELKQEVLGTPAGQEKETSSAAEEDDTTESSRTESAVTTGSADANERFVEKVLDFCKGELANISYDTDTRSLPLDILQTEKGELQIDLNQLDAIDRAVIRF